MVCGYSDTNMRVCVHGQHASRCVCALLALTLAGCAGGTDDEAGAAGETAPNIVQPGAPGQPSRTLTQVR